MSEIVAARIGTLITNDPATIQARINGVSQWLTREHMQLMAVCDLGPRWQALAEGPTLFVIDADGRPQRAHSEPGATS